MTARYRLGAILLAGLAVSSCAEVTAEDFKPVSPSAVILGTTSNKFSAYEAEKGESYAMAVLRLRVRHADEPRATGIVTVNQPISSSHTAPTGFRERTTINRSMGGESSRSQVTEEGHRAEIAAAGGTVLSSRETNPARSRETTFERSGVTCVLVGAAPYVNSSRGDDAGYQWVVSGIFCGPETYRAEFSRFVRDGNFRYVYPRS